MYTLIVTSVKYHSTRCYYGTLQELLAVIAQFNAAGQYTFIITKNV